jgi:hypothetical protein
MIEDRIYVNARLTEGWRYFGSIADERDAPEGYARGVLCIVHRTPPHKPLEERQVWVDDAGAVVADVDQLGNIITADGRKL